MNTQDVVDFDVAGIGGVRLLDAGEPEIAAVARQLGIAPGRSLNEPGVVIHFVDRLQAGSPVQLLGVDDAAFTDDAFLVLRSKHKSRARVQIPFATLGESAELVCERGVTAVPLLISIFNLTLLARGTLPLHASAFVHRGLGIVATGWSKGGKTEALLGFAAHGARYVGDEWVYVVGGRVYGIREPVRVWDWHLEAVPSYRASVARSDRVRLRGLRLVEAAVRGLADSTGYRCPSRRVANGLGALLRSQAHVDVAPGALFGAAMEASCPLDLLFLVGSHERPEIDVAPVDAREVAARMTFSLLHERLDLAAYYLKFRFAFPEARNPLLEQLEDRQRALLHVALADKRSFSVSHPYPVSIEALYRAMDSQCRPTGMAVVDGA